MFDDFEKSQPSRNNEQSFNKSVILLNDNRFKRLNTKNKQNPPILVDFATLFRSETRMLEFGGQK